MKHNPGYPAVPSTICWLLTVIKSVLWLVSRLSTDHWLPKYGHFNTIQVLAQLLGCWGVPKLSLLVVYSWFTCPDRACKVANYVQTLCKVEKIFHLNFKLCVKHFFFGVIFGQIFPAPTQEACLCYS